MPDSTQSYAAPESGEQGFHTVYLATVTPQGVSDALGDSQGSLVCRIAFFPLALWLAAIGGGAVSPSITDNRIVILWE